MLSLSWNPVRKAALLSALLWAWAAPGAFALDVELIAAVGTKGEKPGQFSEPTHVAVDREGNIHVADSENGRIQVLGSQGEVLREYGNANVRVRLKRPWGIALGPDGNMYVSDRDQGRIFSFAPNGSQLDIISVEGSKPGALAKPMGLAIDSQGKIYVADNGNRRVSVFTSAGIFLHAINSDWDKKADFDKPVDVAVDPSDNLYVLDEGKSRVVIFDRFGVFVRQVAGETAAGFRDPTAIAVDRSGTIAVLDGNRQGVRHLGPAGEPYQPFGARGKQPGQFDDPSGFAFDDERNRFIVADTGNNRVQLFKILKRELDKPLPRLSPAMEVRFVRSIKAPGRDVAVSTDGTTLYASVKDQKKVIIFDAESGNAKSEILEPEDSPGNLREPTGLAFANDTLYVTDQGRRDVKAFTAKGIFQFKFGQPGSDPGEFSEPTGMDFAGDDLYIADAGNDRIQILSAKGVFKRLVQGPDSGRLSEPWDVTVAPDGSLYVADTQNHQLRKFLPAGPAAFAKGGRGYGRSLFEEPRGIARDRDGLVYVLDKNGVQVFEQDGQFIMRFGAGGLSGTGNFLSPTCLGIDARKGARLFVCDPEQGVIQVFDVLRIPSAPQAVKLEAELDKSVLSWTAAGETFREKFVLDVAESASGPWTEAASASDSPYTVQYPLPAPGTFFRLKARSYAGLDSVPSPVFEDRFQRGLAAYKAGKYPEAIAAFDAQLAATAGHPPSMLYKGRALAKTLKFDEATNVLSDLARNEKWTAPAYLALAELFLAAGKVQSADDNVRKVLETQPQNAAAWRLHAAVAIQKGLYEDAVERANKSLQIEPENVEAYLLLGDAYMAKKIYPDAIKSYIEAQKADKKNVYIYTKLAAAFLGHGDRDQAVKALKAAAKLESSSADIHIQIAMVYYEAGDKMGARESLVEASKIAPGAPAIDALQGRILFDEKDYNGALAAFLRASEKDPNNRDLQLRLGLAYQAMNKQAEAKAVFHKVIALTPETSTAQFELGRTFMQYKLYDLALDTFDKLSKIDPQNPEVPRYTGEAYYNLRKFPQAISKLEEASRFNPSDSQIHFMLGQVYWQSDLKDKAIARMKLASFISPREPTYLGELGKAYLEKKEFKKAADALRQAVEALPQNSVYAAAYREARGQAEVTPRSGGGPLEVTEVTFKSALQSQFRELESGGFSTVFLKNNARQTVHRIKVSLLAEGFMNFASEEYLASVDPGQTRSVELKAKFNQAAYDLKKDVYTLAEIQIEYFFNKRQYKESIYEPFLLRADLNATESAAAP